MEGKEIEVNGRKYVLGAYNHEGQTIIKDESYDALPGSDDIKVKIGMLNSLTVYFSLIEWEFKDKEDKPVPIMPKLDLEGNNRKTLVNFREYIPPNDMDVLFVAASKLNRMTDVEKKT